MSKIEKIRAEIDRRYNEYSAKKKTDDFIYYSGMADALDLFEQFLDTLLEEPASKGYDEAYLNEKIAKASKTWDGVDVDKYMDEVRGREPDKNLEEAAVDIADNLLAKPKDYALAAKADYWNGAHDGFIAGAQWQEKRNEETIKTAEDHAFLAGADWQKEQDLAEMAQSKSPLSVAYTNRCFENGKQVMKEQMLKDAVDGVVENWNSEPHPEITIPLNPEEFTAGDKVKLIIVKED